MGEQAKRQLISFQGVSRAKNILLMVPLYSPHLGLVIIISLMTYSMGNHFLAFYTFYQLFYSSIRRRCKNMERVSIQTVEWRFPLWVVPCRWSTTPRTLGSFRPGCCREAWRGPPRGELTLACASTPWRGYGTKKDSVNLPCRSKV